jgi:hypothetical protein
MIRTFLLLGPAAALLGTVVGYALGGSLRRLFAAVALGIPPILGLFLWAWLAASTEPCSECTEVLGRWTSVYLSFFLAVNAVAWLAGASSGWAVRRTLQLRLDGRP